jgi:uncharacterized membrane protein
MTDLRICAVLQCLRNLFAIISVPLVKEHFRFTELLGALHGLSSVCTYKNSNFAKFPDSPVCSHNALDFGKSLVPSAVTFMFICCLMLHAYTVFLSATMHFVQEDFKCII